MITSKRTALSYLSQVLISNSNRPKKIFRNAGMIFLGLISGCATNPKTHIRFYNDKVSVAGYMQERKQHFNQTAEYFDKQRQKIIYSEFIKGAY